MMRSCFYFTNSFTKVLLSLGGNKKGRVPLRHYPNHEHFFNRHNRPMYPGSRFKVTLIKPSRSPSITALILPFFKSGPVVACQVWHEDIGTDLAAPGNFFLVSLYVLNSLQVFTFFDFHQFRFQHAHSNIAVLVLATFHLARDDNTRGNMNQAYRRRSLIDLLSTRTTGTVLLHFNVIGLISTSTESSISGMTSREAKEVCRRPEASNGETRTSRCTPFSLFKKPYAFSPSIRMLALSAQLRRLPGSPMLSPCSHGAHSSGNHIR